MPTTDEGLENRRCRAKGLFRTLIELTLLAAMIYIILSAVKLVTEGPKVLDDLRTVSDKRVEIPASGACPEHYQPMDQT